MEASSENVFRSCHAHVHRSHVVRPSVAIDSSRNGGRGGGGTKRPFHRPLSLASNGSGESKESSSMAFCHQFGSPDSRLNSSSSTVRAAAWMAAVADAAEVANGSYVVACRLAAAVVAVVVRSYWWWRWRWLLWWLAAGALRLGTRENMFSATANESRILL